MIRTLTAMALLVLTLASASVGQSWLQVASMPGAGRHHPVTFSLDGYGYAATGTTAAAGYTDDFYRYDPASNTWTTLADFPGPDRSYAYGGTYNGKAYLGFGVGTVFLADLWEFDPVTGWTQLASLPGAARTHPAFVITDDGKIFVGTGGGQGGNLRDWWEYDIASNTWTQRTIFPGAARHHPFYFNIGNTPYVGFGHGAAIYKDFYRFNRDSNTWTRMTDFPGEGRVAGTQFTWQGKGYVLSGEGQDHQKLDTGEFWEYHYTEDRWIQLTPHPGSGRWAPGSLLIGDTLYFMAGTSTVQMEHDMWTFDMTTTANAAEPIGLDAAFTLYPNPVVGQRQFRFPSAVARDVTSIRLLGTDGRQLGELASRSAQVELPRDLASGQYFLSFSMKDGKRHTRPLTVLR